MPTKQQPLPVVYQLQNAIRTSGLSLNELGRRIGVSEGQLSRFLRGDRTLTLPAAARVCQYFGLELCRQEKGFTGGHNRNGNYTSPSDKGRTRRGGKRGVAPDANVD
jgi:transcriptional regulator with XRE-family HTH domain